MAKIIRTPTRAEGGITDAERAAMAEHAKLWIRRAMRTEPADPDKLIPAIKGLYAAANLKEPRVVIVPSPLVMAFAYGAAAAIWHVRKTGQIAATDDATRAATLAATRAATAAATDDATRAATAAATYTETRAATDAATLAATLAATADATAAATYTETRAATDDATRDATDDATLDATAAATRDATDAATDAPSEDLERAAAQACKRLARDLGLACARQWHRPYQGGAYWAAWDCYLTAARDIIGLRLPPHDAYAHWEQAAIHGTFRVMHEEFCIVSDFPEVLRVDDQNRPHCENGPSHRWRDGWSLYHWHGIRVPQHWIEDRADLTAAEVLREENVERRMAGCQIIGWAKVAEQLDRRIIDGDPASDIGALVELRLPGLPEPGRFLMAVCPRNGTICEGVPRVSDIDGLPINTAIAAQAWRDCLPASEYTHPTLRT